MNSLETVLPTRRGPKSTFYASKVIYGNFPMALTFNTLVNSLAPSVSLITIVATITFASSEKKLITMSFFYFGAKIPKISELYVTLLMFK